MGGRRRCRGRSPYQPGFTLLELLVVVGTIATLIAILSTALTNVRAASRKVLCMNQLREVVFRFTQFADPNSHPNRGDSEHYGPTLFMLEDFQESLYRIDEFWDAGNSTDAPCDPGRVLLVCPAASPSLTRHRGLPCSQYAVTPARSISTAFNMRLQYISSASTGRLQRIRLTTQIRERPWVPLVLDADGNQATTNGVMPYYAAPAAGDRGLYGTQRFWFPASRHGGRCNVGFIGGHVLSAATPDKAGGWQWGYQPPAN